MAEAAERRKGEYGDDAARDKARWDAEYAFDQMFQQVLYDTAKAGIERARSGADVVQRAAAAVGTIYAGALALAYSVTDNPLPPRGIIPGLFLAFSIVASTVYLAYITTPGTTTGPDGHSSIAVMQMNRLRFFGEWISRATLRRANWLRAGVLSLGLGVAFLPAAFVHFPNHQKELSESLSQIEWPSPPTEVHNIEFDKILYQAQVDKASAASARVTPVGRAEEIVSWSAAALGLIALLGILFQARLESIVRKPIRWLLAVRPPRGAPPTDATTAGRV